MSLRRENELLLQSLQGKTSHYQQENVQMNHTKEFTREER